MDHAVLAAADLRETVQAGRGRCTDLSLSYRDWAPPPDLMVGQVTPTLLRVYHEQTIVLGTSLFELPEAEVTEEGVILLDGVFQYANQLNIFPSISRGISARSRRGCPTCGGWMSRSRSCC